MVFLRLLGHPTIYRPEPGNSSIVLQRRRLSLLALLAVHADSGVSRDKVLAYLWPEADDDRGRHALSNAVYVLRQALGRNVILSNGSESLRLNPEAARVDVLGFREALEREEREAAVALYAGPFMDGFFLSDAPEFERWVESERDRLARQYATALEALAEATELAGDPASAAEWWVRRAAHEPYSTRVALRSVSALASAGETVRALQHGRAHAELLRADLAVEPDPQVEELLERLRVEGPATVTAASSVPNNPPHAPAGSDNQPQAEPPRTTAPESRLRRNSRGTVVAGAVLLPLLAGGILHLSKGEDEVVTGTSAGIRSLAVLPLENCTPARASPHQGDPAQEYLADGLTDALITEVAQIPGLRVTSRTSAMRFKGQCGSGDRRGLALDDIATQLNVDAVLEGTLVREGNRLRVNLQLIRTATDEHLWARGVVYEHEMEDILTLQAEIAHAVSQAVRSNAPRIPGFDRKIPPRVDPAAYAHYLQGRYIWNERRLDRYPEALEHFNKALAIDPNFAPAYSGLADVYVHLDEWGGRPEQGARVRGFEAAHRALALDARLAEAHTSLAHLLMHSEEWGEAEREYRRAIELDPSNAEALTLYAFQLAAWERHEEAIRRAEQAVAAGPIDIDTNNFRGYTYYFVRRYEDAIVAWERLLDLHPDQLGAHFRIAIAQVLLGRNDEGLQRGRKAVSLADGAPWAQVAWATVLAVAGKPGEAQRVLSDAVAAAPERLDPLATAQAYAALGDPDHAFHWMDVAGGGDHGWLMFLRVEPSYDLLRADPRFRAWLQDMRLVE